MTVGSCVYPHTWILQHIAPGVDNPAPPSSDLGQMLTCRRMEWQKCTSLLKAWGGWDSAHYMFCKISCSECYQVQNHVDGPTYIWLGVQTLRFKLVNFSSCGSWSTRVFASAYISVWTWILSSVSFSVWGCCPSKRWCDCIKICYWLHKTSRLFHRGFLSSASAGACLCLPWASLVHSVIVAAGTFHLSFAGRASHQR